MTFEICDACWTINKITKHCYTKFKGTKLTIVCLIRYHLLLDFSIDTLISVKDLEIITGEKLN